MFSRYDKKSSLCITRNEHYYSCEYMANFFEILFKTLLNVTYFLVNLLIIMSYLLSIYFVFLLSCCIVLTFNNNNIWIDLDANCYNNMPFSIPI